MHYEISLDRKQVILWSVGLALFCLLIFLAGLVIGLRLWMPPTARANATPAGQTQAATIKDTKDAKSDKQEPAAAQSAKPETAAAKSEAAKPEAAKPEAAKPEAAKPEDDVYSIQIGAYLDAKAARQLQTDMKERGYITTLFKAIDADQKMWSMIRIPGFKDLPSATKAAADFTTKEQIQAIVRRSGTL